MQMGAMVTSFWVRSFDNIALCQGSREDLNLVNKGHRLMSVCFLLKNSVKRSRSPAIIQLVGSHYTGGEEEVEPTTGRALRSGLADHIIPSGSCLAVVPAAACVLAAMYGQKRILCQRRTGTRI